VLQICLGPVCVPLHLLLPFLLTLAHQRGYLRWIKSEWLRFSFWREKLWRKNLSEDVSIEPPQSSAAHAPQAADGGGSGVAKVRGGSRGPGAADGVQLVANPAGRTTRSKAI
jgi:hypothetical protein